MHNRLGGRIVSLAMWSLLLVLSPTLVAGQGSNTTPPRLNGNPDLN